MSDREFNPFAGIVAGITEGRRCRRCHRFRPFDQFRPVAGGDSSRAECRQCEAEKQQERIDSRPIDEVRAQRHAHYVANREKIKARALARYYAMAAAYKEKMLSTKSSISFDPKRPT